MRRSGKTTRTIDEAIQILFTKGAIKIPNSQEIDRLPPGRTSAYLKENNWILDPDWTTGSAQEDLYRRIFNRLEIEHPNRYTVDRHKREFKIK